MLSVTENGDLAYIYTPYNPRFVAAVKKISGARWVPKEKAWCVGIQSLDHVREIMYDIYGETDLEQAEMKTLKIRILKKAETLRGPVTLAGRVLARAFNRDSGAIIGEDCELNKGEIRSGGSIINWTTVIEEGSVIFMRNVPENLIGKIRKEGSEWVRIEQIE